MKKTSAKLTALGLSMALALSAGGAACARSFGGEDVSAAPVRLSAAADSAAQPAAYRDETVYVLTGAGGQVEKVIVSDWLKNPDGLAHLADGAALTGVENVKGYETCSPSGAGRVWDAQGGDIYCQGSTDKELPVEVSVSYTLDGRSVQPEQLAGKSGHVSIRFDYVNRQYEDVEINGQRERIYTPFAMLTGVVLNNDHFSNVSAANARVYNDGGRTAVVGLALPGLRESLGLENADIPEYVEISADVTDFQLSSTFTVAVSDLFGELDTEALDTDELTDSLDELTDAMDQLLNGSGKLYDGLGELLEKSGELASGVEQLAEGAGALRTGADSLREGADELATGAAGLQKGLEQLSAGSEALNDGAEQVFQSLLASANQQLAASGAKLPELTAENYGKVLEGAVALVGAESPTGQKLAGLKASLDSYSVFYQGLLQYTAGVDQASGGARSLAQGADGLSQGAEALSGGVQQLDGGLQALRKNIPALTDGVKQLRDGAGELADGLEQFNEEGVQKIVDALDGDLEGLADRLEVLTGAAREYRSFSGGQEADGQVKFIYRTASIETEE